LIGQRALSLFYLLARMANRTIFHSVVGMPRVLKELRYEGVEITPEILEDFAGLATTRWNSGERSV
jgi:hypothetical protein